MPAEIVLRMLEEQPAFLGVALPDATGRVRNAGAKVGTVGRYVFGDDDPTDLVKSSW